MRVERLGRFDVGDEDIFKDGNLFLLHATWDAGKITYEGITCSYPLPIRHHLLGSSDVSARDLKKYSKRVISEAERIIMCDEGSVKFKNSLTKARAAGAEFAENVLTPDASEMLIQSLSAPGGMVALIVSDDLKGVPWELCHLSNKDLQGFVNELGRFERSITGSGDLRVPSRLNSKVSLIVDKALESKRADQKLIHERLRELGVFGLHKHAGVLDKCGRYIKTSGYIVYLGHHTAEGIRLDDDVCFDRSMLNVHPFPREGVCVLASCRAPSVSYGVIDDILKHNQLATGIGDECGCNVIYSLIRLPLERGLDIAGHCCRALVKSKNPSLWDAWENVKKDVDSVYLWFFSMQGTWSRRLL